ncbi:iron-containing alcohol dehydrogenase [Alicyclobacillus suci]|uniref:iron-containing alcohol dehydrogenase n=1 Tax=Alicyclobacillus suci TaxID=2816080 RepID=UPI001A8FDC2E|nr:iron-containing alcohol dehydrogenase [Alicyclobacillus suci]
MGLFSIYVPTHVYFGEGRLQRDLPDLIRKYDAQRILIVTDAGLMRVGIVPPIVELLEKQGMVVHVFGEVEPDPSVDTVHRVADVFRQARGELLLAIGGGSSIDTAKGARVILGHGGHIRDYAGIHAKPIKAPVSIPLIAIPTTAGTGSEVTFFGVYSDWENNVKVTVTSPFVAPDVALVDPSTTYSLPAKVTASTGIDVLAHAVEAFVSRAASHFSDTVALRAMALVEGNLRAAVTDGANREARNRMAEASLLAGIAFNHAFLGLTHAVAAAVSGHAHVPHGVAIGLLLPHVMQFNLGASPDKFRQIANAMVGSWDCTPEDAVLMVNTLTRDIGLPQTLREVGVTESMLEGIARQSLTSVQLRFNPKNATEQDIFKLVTAIY